MKKLVSIFVAAAAIVLAASCQKEAETYAVTVNVVADVDADVVTPDAYDVTVTNTANQVATTVKTENGKAVVSGLVAGVYNVVVAAKINAGFDYIFSGAVQNVSVLADTDVDVKVTAAKSSPLVFKEIYYSGAKGNGYYFRDQFYEIYNQGTDVVYLDGLCIAETVNTCYDEAWDEVVCTWDIADADKYVFTEVVWQVPGNGTEYPLQPGESFVIAQWAVDHRVEELSAGCSEMDLSGAEFEAVNSVQETFSGLVLTDNVALNLNKVINTLGYDLPQWLTSVAGSSYIIFFPSTPLVNDNFIMASNSNPDSPTEGREVLISDILDGVQACADEEAAQILKLPVSVDAGWISCGDDEGAWYKGRSIARKQAGEADGHPVFQDTNNTTADFEVFDTPVVRRYEVGRPAWNTWAK